MQNPKNWILQNPRIVGFCKIQILDYAKSKNIWILHKPNILDFVKPISKRRDLARDPSHGGGQIRDPSHGGGPDPKSHHYQLFGILPEQVLSPLL